MADPGGASSAKAERESQLQFQLSPKAVTRSRRKRVVIATVLLVGGGLFTGVIVYSLSSGSVSDSLAIAGIIGLAAGLAIVLMLVLTILSRGPVAIGGGTISLGSSIRLRNGSRTREVPLSDITDIEPMVGPDGEHGVRVLLSGGTFFFLDQEEFEEKGLEIMAELSSGFGHDYQEELKTILLEGRRAGFWVGQPLRIDGGELVLKKKVYPSRGKGMRRILLREITEIEDVSTHYSGPSILVTLADGARFLLPWSDVESVGLNQHPDWKVARQS